MQYHIAVSSASNYLAHCHGLDTVITSVRKLINSYVIIVR